MVQHSGMDVPRYAGDKRKSCHPKGSFKPFPSSCCLPLSSGQHLTAWTPPIPTDPRPQPPVPGFVAARCTPKHATDPGHAGHLFSGAKEGILDRIALTLTALALLCDAQNAISRISSNPSATHHSLSDRPKRGARYRCQGTVRGKTREKEFASDMGEAGPSLWRS